MQFVREHVRKLVIVREQEPKNMRFLSSLVLLEFNRNHFTVKNHFERPLIYGYLMGPIYESYGGA